MSAGAAAAAPEVLVSQRMYTTVAGGGGHVLWSQFDAARRRFFLVELEDGRMRRLPVAPRRIPFDVDVGRGPNGRTWAVYTRCETERLVRRGRIDVPASSRSRGCAILGLDLRTGRERRLVRIRRRAAAFNPVVWGHRLVYIRSEKGRYALISRIGNRVRAIRGPGLRAESGPTSFDLRGSTLALAWYAEVEACPDGAAAPMDVNLELLFVIDLRQRTRRTLEERCLGSGVLGDRPVLLPRGALLYFREEIPARSFRLVDLSTGAAKDAPAPDVGSVLSVATDGRDVYTTREVFTEEGGIIEVRREGALP